MASHLYHGLFVTDLDGTLTDSVNTIADSSRDALVRLQSRGIIVVIATGRNLHSAKKVLKPDFPFDYLIFSGGAGTLHWRTFEMVDSHLLNSDEVREITERLIDLRCDFMVQAPIPENHFFKYWDSGRQNPDFLRRREVYATFHGPYQKGDDATASQVIVVEPSLTGASRFEELKTLLGHYAIVRTTSPLDQASIWIEILPKGISKASASERIRLKHDIPHSQTFAIGNDYNDIDLLRWAHRSCVVESSPVDLKNEFIVTRGPEGLAHAVDRWLQNSH